MKTTMKFLLQLSTAALPCLGGAVAKPLTDNTHPGVIDGPPVVHAAHGVTYHGLARNGIEVFLGIPYGQDTSGAARFQPPRKHVPQPGSRVDATAYGPSCPQALGEWAQPISLGSISEVSEDCLSLNVARPSKGVRVGEGERLLPVMVYIHGGSFWAGDGHDPTILPDGLVREAVGNDGRGVVHVAMNYRLGCKSTVTVEGGAGEWTVFFEAGSTNLLQSLGSRNRMPSSLKGPQMLVSGTSGLLWSGSETISRSLEATRTRSPSLGSHQAVRFQTVLAVSSIVLTCM